jgi:mono/diheme cytochrome c family protein
MRRGGFIAASAAGFALASCIGAALANTDKQDFPDIAKGRYLTIAGDCTACHTNPGSPAFAGGRPIPTPFGTVVAPNVTPDVATGIGAWTDDQFVAAVRNGIGRDGANLYPAMPYTYYTRATRNDILAIRAYLATVPAVKNEVHSNELPFPFNIRTGMTGWNELFFNPGPFKPVAGKGALWNRGAYLVEGLAHCGMCHTPKNKLGGDETSHTFQGYTYQGWFAPNITNDTRLGLGNWSIDDIVTYLKTGHNRFGAASGPMAEEISDSSALLSGADLRAIATYLKDQPGEPPEAVPQPDQAVMKEGAAIYADECSACHAPKGEGSNALFPMLAGSPSVQSKDPTSLIRVVLQGARSVATPGAPTAPAMPSFGWVFNNDEVAAVTTYLRNAWGNAAPVVTAGAVADARHSLSQRSD